MLALWYDPVATVYLAVGELCGAKNMVDRPGKTSNIGS